MAERVAKSDCMADVIMTVMPFVGGDQSRLGDRDALIEIMKTRRTALSYRLIVATTCLFFRGKALTWLLATRHLPSVRKYRRCYHVPGLSSCK